MSNYDLQVSDAKLAATRSVCRAIETKGANLDELALVIDNLNAAWDALTDALVRQRDERDRQIRRLMDELAEANKK